MDHLFASARKSSRLGTRQAMLRRHRTTVCGLPKSNLKKKISLYFKSLNFKTDHICDLCGAAFSHILFIRSHMYSHKTKPKKKYPRGPKHTSCQPCGIVSISIKDFRGKHAETRRHKELAKDFYCPICSVKVQWTPAHLSSSLHRSRLSLQNSQN